MLGLCALPSVLSKLVQRRKILFSTEAIPDFNALPLQARLACFFFFCLSFARQPYLTLLWEDVFLSPRFASAPGFGHNCPTRLQQGGEQASLVSFLYSIPKTAHRATRG